MDHMWRWREKVAVPLHSNTLGGLRGGVSSTPDPSSVSDQLQRHHDSNPRGNGQ
jgi:hypothetical protein